IHAALDGNGRQSVDASYHRFMWFRSSSVVVALAIASSAVAAGRPMTPEDLLAMARISDPQLSPDRTPVLYTAGVPDMGASRIARDVWWVTIATGEARNLTRNGRDGGARWSPDGKTIAFVSTRSNGTQIYAMSADGAGEPRPLTALSTGADNIVWAPDGR